MRCVVRGGRTCLLGERVVHEQLLLELSDQLLLLPHQLRRVQHLSSQYHACTTRGASDLGGRCHLTRKPSLCVFPLSFNVYNRASGVSVPLSVPVSVPVSVSRTSMALVWFCTLVMRAANLHRPPHRHTPASTHQHTINYAQGSELHIPNPPTHLSMHTPLPPYSPETMSAPERGGGLLELRGLAPDAGQHEGAAVAADRVLEQVRQLALPVWHVGPTAAHQRHHALRGHTHRRRGSEGEMGLCWLRMMSEGRI